MVLVLESNAIALWSLLSIKEYVWYRHEILCNPMAKDDVMIVPCNNIEGARSF